jgi:hypothetical protein
MSMGEPNDAPVLGAMSREEVLAKLAEMDDPRVQNVQADITGQVQAEIRWPWSTPPAYMHTTMAIGFLPPVKAGEEPVSLRHAGQIEPERDLRGQRIKITLDRLRVADFPGNGMHHVLFDFQGRNQAKDAGVEDVHFNASYRVLEGEHAPIIGYPVFVGLSVGQDGVGFQGFTVNVKNESDEAFLNVLESDAFRSGLTLIETAQPAIKPLSQMAVGMASAIAKRNRNVKVQEFSLGLDFSDIATRAKLAQGSYVVVQIPESMGTLWRWSDWVYDPESGYVVKKDDPQQTIPYNYIVFGVSRYG